MIFEEVVERTVANELRSVRCPSCGTLLMQVHMAQLKTVCRRCKAHIQITVDAATVKVEIVPKAQ